MIKLKEIKNEMKELTMRTNSFDLHFVGLCLSTNDSLFCPHSAYYIYFCYVWNFHYFIHILYSNIHTFWACLM